jgi:hypothetical protein
MTTLTPVDRWFYGAMGAVFLVCAIALIVMAVTGQEL